MNRTTTELRPPLPATLSVPVLVVIGVLTAVPPLVTDLYLPAMPALADEFGGSAALAQLTMSVSLVGLALGQLVVGPLSDRIGRLKPLRWGLALLAVTSVLCAVAPTIELLLVARLLQGLAGSAAVVISRAMVRDVYDGPRLARIYSELMLIMGLAPAVGPVIGGQMLHFTTWRGIFVALGIVTVVLLLAVALMLPETRRSSLSPTSSGPRSGGLLRLLADRRFVPYLAVTCFAGAVLFSYLTMSPFVLQDGYGLSPAVYSLVFGANALGMVLGSQVNANLVMRFGPRAMATAALALLLLATSCVALLQAVEAPVVYVLVPLWLVLVGFGGVTGNAAALAMEHQSELAGTASALLGTGTFLFGAVIPPLVSVSGTGGATMGLTMAVAAGLALLSLTVLGPRASGLGVSGIATRSPRQPRATPSRGRPSPRRAGRARR